MRVSEKSLQRLFARYNALFYDRQLVPCTVLVDGLDGLKGICERACRRIRVDLSCHRDAADARATLIHEMIHLVTSGGHGFQFWYEADRVLRMGAPTGLADVCLDAAEELASVLRQHNDYSEYVFVRRALYRNIRMLRSYGIFARGPQYEALQATTPSYEKVLAVAGLQLATTTI